MGNVYFVRHGESQANATGILAGASESPLTEKGRQQAHDEALQVATKQFAVILASPLSRAYETAKVIAKGCDYPETDIVIIDDLRERHAGSFEGGLVATYHQATSDQVAEAGGESAYQYAERVARTNNVIREYAHRGDVLVVAHDGTYRMSMCLQQQKSPEDMLAVDRPVNSRLMEYPL